MLVGASAAMVKFNLPCGATDCVDAIQPSHLEGPVPPAEASVEAGERLIFLAGGSSALADKLKEVLETEVPIA